MAYLELEGRRRLTRVHVFNAIHQWLKLFFTFFFFLSEHQLLRVLWPTNKDTNIRIKYAFKA